MAETTKTNKTKGLYPKLLELQRSIKGLAKNEKAYGYDYVSGSKLLFFVRPLMDDLGLLLLPSTKAFSSQIVKTQEASTKNGKPVPEKYENLVTITKTFTWVDAETGEKESFDFTAQGCNNWDKGAGSAETYAERYFLLKFFHIATDADDVDAIHNEPAEPEQPQQQSGSLEGYGRGGKKKKEAEPEPIYNRLDDIEPGFYQMLVEKQAEDPNAYWTLADGTQLNTLQLFHSYGPTEQEVQDFLNRAANHRELFVNNK